MKKIYLFIALLLPFAVFAQMKVGDNPNTIAPSAVLEAESVTKGFLMPRLTTLQMNAIVNPVQGLMVYNTTERCIFIYKGAIWDNTCNAFNSWNIGGNDNIGPNHFIGTNYAVPLIFKTNNKEAIRIAPNGNVGIGNINPQFLLDVNATINPVRFQGLGIGSGADYIVTDSAGILRHRPLASIFTNPTFSGNVQVNPNGTGTTTIGNPTSTTQISGNSLNISNLPQGASSDNLVTIDPNTGKVKQLDMATVGANLFNADNGLTKTGNKVQLGGELLKNTTIDQKNNNLEITGGKMSIGGTAPNSTLSVTGSMANSFRKINISGSITENDYSILVNCTANSVTLTLPNANTCTGRKYILIKSDESENKMIFSPNLKLTETTTLPSINYSSHIEIQSDGTDWWVIKLF